MRQQPRIIVGGWVAAPLVFGDPAPPTVAVAAPPDQLCHLVLTSEHMPSVAVERGVAFHRDFQIDLRHCTFVMGEVSRRNYQRPARFPGWRHADEHLSAFR